MALTPTTLPRQRRISLLKRRHQPTIHRWIQAQVVLDARELYEDATIAQMYDPDYDWLYPELTAAHHALDAAVEQAYGLEPGCDEKIMVERLFQLYAKTIKRLSA